MTNADIAKSVVGDETYAEALRIAERHHVKMGWKFTPIQVAQTAREMIAALLATDGDAAAWIRRADHWLPPPEPERSEGYRCIALVELEWAKDFSGAFGWHRPDEHAMMMIEADAPGIHGFLPLAEAPAVSLSVAQSSLAYDTDQRALAVADDMVRMMMDRGALLAVRDNDGELVPMDLGRQFQLKACWQSAIAAVLKSTGGVE